MKKLSILILSILLALSLSVTAWAITVDDVTQPTTIPVTATYEATSNGETVYSVDISWGSMAFTYQAGGDIWNPKTHQYDSTDSGWIYDEGANQITIKNHSNIYLNCDLNFQSSLDSVTGELSDYSLYIDNAERTSPTSPPTGTATLTLNGTLSSNTGNATQIGTITVTISEAQ